jgi:Uma2 family endonuclease
MATNPRTATITLDDFVAALEAGDERLEFVNGEIVAMTAAPLEHGLIAQSVATSMSVQLRGRPCRVVSQGTLVGRTEDENAFIPDVAVYCGEPRRQRVRGTDRLLNPVVIVEVLSPSTAGYDRGQKWESYRGIPTLQDYLLVTQDAPRVERFTRHGEHFWLYGETTGLDGEIQLESLNVTLKLADIYDGVLSADSGREE